MEWSVGVTSRCVFCASSGWCSVGCCVVAMLYGGCSFVVRVRVCGFVFWI